jgi:two-component system, chemotaxis family, chemotaxis protein CheY
MSKLRVLVVDDDNLMRELLKAILREEGYRVVGDAKDGQAALAACDKLTPDLVCLDVNMPGMSGIDILKTLRRQHTNTRVVMITGDSSLTTVREAVSHGAAGYIIKPFSSARVADALREALKPASIFQ